MDSELQVGFDAVTGHAVWVGLRVPGGLRPTDLQRFPWSTFLRVADAADRGLRAPSMSKDSEHLSDVMRAQRAGERLPHQLKIVKRPGRHGHGDSFYLEKAQRYEALVAAGVTNPTTTIAREYYASRNTVAGWVREARKRGYLRTARPGRAG